MKNLQLKVNIKSLAAEARIIRHEESRELHRARLTSGWYDRRAVKYITRTDELEEDTKKELLKELNDNKSNGELVQYAPSHYARYTQLQQHRVTKVREEARVALLAYGYVNGKTYDQVENSPNSTVPAYMLHRVSVKVRKHGSSATVHDIIAWYDAGIEVHEATLKAQKEAA